MRKRMVCGATPLVALMGLFGGCSSEAASGDPPGGTTTNTNTTTAGGGATGAGTTSTSGGTATTTGTTSTATTTGTTNTDGTSTTTATGAGGAATSTTATGDGGATSTGMGGATTGVASAGASSGGAATASAGAASGGTTSMAGATATGGSMGMAGAGMGTGGANPFGMGEVIVEDNFDAATAGGAPDTSKWEEYGEFEQMLAPVVDATKANTPPNSVKVTSTNSGRGSFLVPIVGFPVEGNDFYVRVYMNWANAASEIMGHSGFIVGAASRDNSGTEIRLGISTKGDGSVPAMLELNAIGTADGGGGEVSRYSNGFTSGGDPISGVPGFEFAADTWYCVEARFNGTPGASEFQVWIDGTDIESMHVTNFAARETDEPRNDWAPTYTFLKIGAQDYDANLGEIWYDDVVVATDRIGCL